MNQQQLNLKALKQGAALVAGAALAAVLTGCGGAGTSIFTQAGSGSSAFSLHATGLVRGGQQPILGATIQLYTVGTGANGAASTALIASTVTSSDGSGTADSNANAGNASNTLAPGYFTITGDYNCTSATEVYLVATGGNPGAGANANISLVAALGSCTTLLANASFTTINMDEVTTVAAAYALAPFATDLTHVGSASSTAMVNAMNNAQNLANNSTGMPGGTGLPAGAVVPTNELNTLGDILASCVDTTGASSPACSQLFAATGASDVFGAALAIAKSPGASAITNLYSLAGAAGAPFQPTMSLSTVPNDFSVAINYNAGGTLATPWAIAIDAGGDAWVTNETGTAVTELSPAGAVLQSPTATGLTGAQGIAIDRSGNVWVANTAGNSVVEFTLSAGLVSGTNSYTVGGITAPTALAIDSSGDVFVANFNGNSVTELSSAGANLNSSPFTGNSNNITQPVGIAVGHGGGGVYVTSGLGYVVKLNNSGVYKNNLSDGAIQAPTAVAINSNGQIGVPASVPGAAGAMGEFTDSGSVITVSSASPVTTGLTNPAGIATDGANFFVSNSAVNGSLGAFSYGSSTPSSPTAGYGTLNTPVGVAVDGSGCVWTTNSGDNTVSQFIGLAQPATTPLAATAGP